MKPANDRELITSENSSFCPICGRPVAECDSCQLGLEEQFELHEMLEDLASSYRHPDEANAASRAAAVCAGAYPFAASNWQRERSLSFAMRLAAGLVVLLAVAAAFAFTVNTNKQSAPAEFAVADATLDDMAGAFKSAYGVSVLVAPGARQSLWLKRASLALNSPDPERALRAVAYAFDLQLEKWGDTFVLRERELSLMEHGEIRHVKMDLALALEPEAVAQLDSIGNSILMVEGPKFSTQVAQAVRVPLPYDQSTDVKLSTRKDETYKISRTFPWFVVTPDMKLEFMALTDEDVARFEALRSVLRGGEYELPVSAKYLGPLTKPVTQVSATTVREAITRIAKGAGFDVVFGTGAAVDLPVPSSLANAKTIGAALHALCVSRPFYFTWLPDAQMLIVDDRAALQQHLRVMACDIPNGMDGVTASLAISTQFADYFPNENLRTGSAVVELFGKLLIRNHSWPLYELYRSPMFSK